jgi:hypothetical protein
MSSRMQVRSIVAIVLLALLLAAVAGVARRAGFRSAPSVDSRTYIEMTRGFAEHGLPYLDNGPADEVPEMRARWNLTRGGHLWGIYPPLFPFAASFVLRAGGDMTLVARLNAGISLALTLLGAFAIARRLSGDPLVGAAAAYASVLATSVGCLVLGSDSFGLVTSLSTWACYFGLRAVDTGGRGAALLAGATGGAAVASHLLAVPMCAGVVAAIALSPREDEPKLLGSIEPRSAFLGRWLPSRRSIVTAHTTTVSASICASRWPEPTARKPSRTSRARASHSFARAALPVFSRRARSARSTASPFATKSAASSLQAAPAASEPRTNTAVFTRRTCLA